MMHKIIKMMIVIVLGCTVLNSVMAQENEAQKNERIKREQAQREVEKHAKKTEGMVRDNEKGWSLERRERGERHVTNYWKNKDEFAEAYDVFVDSIEEAQKLYTALLVLRASSPDKGGLIANLGDAAQILIYPGHSIAIFRKGRHCVNITASSDAVAKRFAKYYDQSLADEK